jgi:predicted alpha-1,6-mannanase (GH76 family)
MHIGIEWHSDQFNVNLSSAEGRPEFLSVKGCRIVSGQSGDFVGWPATKNEKTNKYWRHAWGSDAFNAAVMEAALKTKPAQDTRTLAERKRPKDEVYRAGSPNVPPAYDEDVPF